MTTEFNPLAYIIKDLYYYIKDLNYQRHLLKSDVYNYHLDIVGRYMSFSKNRFYSCVNGSVPKTYYQMNHYTFEEFLKH